MKRDITYYTDKKYIKLLDRFLRFFGRCLVIEVDYSGLGLVTNIKIGNVKDF